MDADITAAASQFDLEKIKAQDYRDALAKTGAQEDARIQLFAKQVTEQTAFVDVTEKTAADLLTSQQEMRLSIVRAIAANYMKPTTGTLASTILSDTNNDANRLVAAVDAVEKIVMGTYQSTATG